jgi:hypothetical protein
MPVAALAPACPRCGRRWPGMRRRAARYFLSELVLVVLFVVLVVLAWRLAGL